VPEGFSHCGVRLISLVGREVGATAADIAGAPRAAMFSRPRRISRCLISSAAVAFANSAPLGGVPPVASPKAP
jgi:hypothetical protein